ncbi:hypothetical protein NM208_g1996 [Fusarium decemcellulare]|uniref:Uncharacterized protein n=1 Tax=Fusarium decemcellulare TaxID=57161 RepID=A0ACC1SUE1_9HYPO|nr:hypothetical protein NM208_g1996 [Fusarium decemcellulare]
MKVATILALPALAIAAATPQIKERDSVITLGQILCVLVVTDIAECLVLPITRGDINNVANGGISCPIGVVNDVRSCLNLPALPIPN